MQTAHNYARPQKSTFALSLLLATLLAACGGGGGDDSGNGTVPGGGNGDTTEPVDDGTNLNDDYAAGSREKSAFDAINAARQAAGLEPLLQNTRVDAAAQAHAEYLTLNDTVGHDELQGNPGFIGTHSLYRIQAKGYDAAQTNEAISYLKNKNRSGAQTIYGHLATVYHRTPFLSAHYTNVGIGVSDYAANSLLGYSFNVVVDFARKVNHTAPLITSDVPGTGYVTWPVDGGKNVALAMSNETPRPVPDIANPGYPISFAVDRSLANGGKNSLTVDTFSLRCNGAPVAARVLTAANDQNLQGYGDTHWAFLVPQEWLPANSTCTATFKGSATSGATYDRTWSFQTGGTTYAEHQ